MRHYSFIVLATLILVMVANNSYANNAGVKKTKHAIQVTSGTASSHAEEIPLPLSPATRHEEHGKKIPVPSRSEELPHIHHFHKDRVKKSERHHKKFWLLSKVILILCHVAILVIAYL